MLLTALRNAVRIKTNNKLKELLINRSSLTQERRNKVTKMANTPTEQQQQQQLQSLEKKPPQQQQHQKMDKPKGNEKPLLRKERQQQAAKKKGTTHIPGTVTLQVLGTGANGSPAAVYLFTDQSRYLFNCGEGTQRLAHEHKTKLARLEQIFVTRNTWPTIGGIPGLALTVQDAGVKELALHGPPYLDNILMSMKRFVALKTLQLKTVDCTENLDFEDAVMKVKSLPLYRSTLDNKQQSPMSTNPAQESVAISYICNLKPRPGALNLEKCVEHGVPPGPLLGLLKNGVDVTLENGTIVKSADVSEPNENPLSFLFLDIPTTDFLFNLEKHKDKLVNTKIYKDNTTALVVVVHFSPQDVVKNNVYQAFLESFAPATQHIFLNSSQNTYSGYISAHRIQYQLNQLNPRVFPILAEATTMLSNLSCKLKKTKLDDEHVGNVNGEDSTTRYSECSAYETQLTDLNSMSVYHLRPRKGLDRTNEIKLQPNDYINESQILADFPPLLEKLKVDFQNRSYAASSTTTRTMYPIITFLGTGSCIPNKTRNVSSILIQTAADSYVLLDCGEGTLGQIQRMFGVTKAQDVVKKLKIIYVSHLHADHHIGLIGLLTESLKLREQQEDISKKILIMAPRQIESWLNFYQQHIYDIKDSYELIGNAEMLNQPLDLYQDYGIVGVDYVKTCLVKHCPHSFGVKLIMKSSDEHEKEPVTITYSGDTMPCQDLVDLGLNSTILIHEATMENDLEEEARLKTHSTISQAIQQGHEMQAKHIVLTHFSQRYAKLPRLQLVSDASECESDMPDTLMSNVAIAFDNMQVSMEDLQHFHLMYPAMHSLFAEHAEELEQKALKRELKLERKRKLLNS